MSQRRQAPVHQLVDQLEIGDLRRCQMRPLEVIQRIKNTSFQIQKILNQHEAQVPHDSSNIEVNYKAKDVILKEIKKDDIPHGCAKSENLCYCKDHQVKVLEKCQDSYSPKKKYIVVSCQSPKAKQLILNEMQKQDKQYEQHKKQIEEKCEHIAKENQEKIKQCHNYCNQKTNCSENKCKQVCCQIQRMAQQQQQKDLQQHDPEYVKKRNHINLKIERFTY